MELDLVEFRAFCADLHASIRAVSCADEAKQTMVPCKHWLGPSPSTVDQVVLDALAPGIREALECFYAYHSSAELFVVDEEAGLELAAPHCWADLGDEIREWWGSAEAELEPDILAMLETTIVFGRIPGAATYFCLVRDGELAGQAAMFVGPGLEFAPIADSFGEFLMKLPTRAIRWIQADVRYRGVDDSDQYFPTEYRRGAHPVPARKAVRVTIESPESRKIARYEYFETLEDGADIEAPSGRRYSIVVELYDNDECSVDVADDEEQYVYVRGFGSLRIQSRLSDGDVLNVAVESPAASANRVRDH